MNLWSVIQAVTEPPELRCVLGLCRDVADKGVCKMCVCVLVHINRNKNQISKHFIYLLICLCHEKEKSQRLKCIQSKILAGNESLEGITTKQLVHVSGPVSVKQRV